ncbi:MAG: tetratricopeptide repeat protein [Terriglobales bacterium]
MYPSAPVSATDSSPSIILLYRFGPYEADTARNELRKFGIRIRLERKPWQLLIALLDHAGEVVTRSELQHSLWGEDVFVDFDTGLNVAVKKLRGALCDSTEGPTYIETVAGEGYRFVAAVEKVSTIAYVPTSALPELIPAALLPPIEAASPLRSLGPDVRVTPAFQTKLNSVPAEADQGAEVPVLQFEQGAQPPLPAGSVRLSWLSKREARSAVAVVVCVALLAIVVARLVSRLRQPEQARAVKIMLVVLPFENLSGDPGQEYLSDGMTEELSEKLGNQDPRQLGVVGRTSAMTYKYSHRTIREIGKELGVDYVLEGSVRRNASEVRVTAQLVQVSDQAHVWAASYDENLGDLLKLERELASVIARQVGVSIAIGQAKKPVQLHDPTPEAHEAYLLGRYHWYNRTTGGWKTAEEYFRLAIQRDPDYAAAYAALAECRIPRGEAQAAALKAIALDPTSGEAYTALAWVQLYWYLDPAAAAPAFRQAIELAPNYAQAHYSYANYLSMTGHPYEAINEVKEAVLLDPLSPLFNSGLANMFSEVGRFDDAVRQLKTVFELDPKFAVAHGALGKIYTQQGKYKEAIEEFQIEGQRGADPDLGRTGYAYARWGNKKQALRILSQLEALEEKEKTSGVSFDLAMVELGLGNKEKAIAWLQKLDEEHEDDSLLWLPTDRVLDPLRRDPRFQDIVRRMNFPP